MTTFRTYADEVYLACTSLMALEYLYKHAETKGVRQWDPDALDGRLRQVGIGLLVVHWQIDGPVVEEVLKPKTSAPTEPKRREVLEHIKGRASLG